MKRIITLLLALLILMTAFSACGKTQAEKEEESKRNLAGDIDDDNLDIKEFDLSIAYFGKGVDALNSIVPEFKKLGYTVKEYKYTDDDVMSLNTKLMAGDDDIDIYFTDTLELHNYLRAGYFADLSEYESLKSRLDANNYAGYVSKYDGKYFGIPIRPYYFDTAEYENGCTELKYELNNVDALSLSYADFNGEELYKALKHLRDNPEDPKDNSFYKEDFKSANDAYLILNPSAANKETAVKFLEMIFDYMTGDFSAHDGKDNELIPTNQYPNIEDMSGVYLYWNSTPWSIIEPIRKAFVEISDFDGDDEALKDLVNDVVSEVNLRISE